MATVFTIGHGTRSLDDLVSILQDAGVEVLVDVRRLAGSRRNPQFNRESLAGTLPQAAIAYEWWGEGLGGRRTVSNASRHVALHNASFRAFADYMDGDEFRAALSGLEEAARERSIAIMCAETVWWRCHRRHIADALVLDGFEVVHLMDRGSRQSYVPHPAMRADEHGRPVYDVGHTGRLLDEP